MLSRIVLDVALDAAMEKNKSMSYVKAVSLQGVLMEIIDTEYAEMLHTSTLHPYSQCVVKNGTNNQWIVNALDKDAYDRIIVPLSRIDAFKITHDDIDVLVTNKSITTVSRSELIKKFYFEDSSRYISVSFITPTSFKSDGRYINYPQISLLYKSLMNKFDSSSSEDNFMSDELLEELINSTVIERYDLHSCIYNVGRYKIPSFMGKMVLKINGAQSLVNFANMLFRFGEYSGIGIKTAMGMGSIKINIVRRDPRSGRMPYDDVPPTRSGLNAAHQNTERVEK